MLGKIFTVIFQTVFDSANVKTATSAGIGSGIVALGVFEAKIATVEDTFKTQIELDKKQIIEYVDVRHDFAITRFQDIVDGQKEMKKDITTKLETLDNRIYNLNQNLKGR
jgi:hypothetical protein